MAKFQPGVSGNPSGKAKLPKELAAIRSLHGDEIKKIVSKFSHMTKEEIEKAVKDPKIPMIHLAIASILIQSTKHGDYGRLAFLLDRTVGKPKEEPEENPESQAERTTVHIILPQNGREAPSES